MYSSPAAGLALLRIVFGERLDFVRRYGAGHQAALLAALADDQVWPAARVRWRSGVIEEGRMWMSIYESCCREAS